MNGSDDVVVVVIVVIVVVVVVVVVSVSSLDSKASSTLLSHEIFSKYARYSLIQLVTPFTWTPRTH